MFVQICKLHITFNLQRAEQIWRCHSTISGFGNGVMSYILLHHTINMNINFKGKYFQKYKCLNINHRLKKMSATSGHIRWGLDMLTLHVLRSEYSDRTRPIILLLMPWLLASLGHQQTWCSWREMGIFLSSLRVNFVSLQHVSVARNDRNANYIFLCSLNKFRVKLIK